MKFECVYAVKDCFTILSEFIDIPVNYLHSLVYGSGKSVFFCSYDFLYHDTTLFKFRVCAGRNIYDLAAEL